MAQSDYMPTRENDLGPWSANIIAYSGKRATLWGVPDPVETLQIPLETFTDALAKCKVPHSPTETQVKNDAKKALKKVMREYIMAYIMHNPKVTHADKVAMGLHVKDEIPTHLDIMNLFVVFTFKLLGPRVVALIFKEADSASKAKPYGVHGVNIKWLVSDHQATTIKQLPNDMTATRSPCDIEFEDEERGKVLSLAMRWVTKKGKLGPWSDIEYTIVP